MAYTRVVVLAGVLSLIACSPSEPADETSLPSSISPEPSKTPDNSAIPATLTVTGPEEVVFDWTTDRCEEWNIPDLPARAYRDSTGQVHLTIAHPSNYQMVGPDLENLTVSCEPILVSTYDADPSQYNDNTWVASPYTEDGTTFYALAHNEYTGHTHPGMCPQNDYYPCWDNSITLLKSTDGGNTWAPHPGPGTNLVARLPYPYEAGQGPSGARTPSNIIKGADDYYYAYFNMVALGGSPQWSCAMRTEDLSDPTSWRYWNSKTWDFDGTFIEPYSATDADAKSHVCSDFGRDSIGWEPSGSVTYNEYLDRYVMVTLSGDNDVWGAYYSFSTDLVRWTPRELLVELTLSNTRDKDTSLYNGYFTLIDPDSLSLNFDTSDESAYLYYTRKNEGDVYSDRDLVRVLVTFELES